MPDASASPPTSPTLVLGAGISGLAVAHACGATVLERERAPGGICTSYYVRPGTPGRLPGMPPDGEAYRFEIGGGHWIFGGAPQTLAFIDARAPLERHARRSSVYFPSTGARAGFPLQYHLRDLEPATAAAALDEILAAGPGAPADTMAQSIAATFGATLTSLFFAPFQSAYTAGLWTSIAPQDAYKTPIDRDAVRRGASTTVDATGYNATFAYPRGGLDAFARSLARECDVRYGREVVRIDPRARFVVTREGERWPYATLVSTLPLDRTLALAGVTVGARADPATGVMVLNLGARRGSRCPDDHWLYVPGGASGLHRVGFYDNVVDHFLPASRRGRRTHAALYVERAWHGATPSPAVRTAYVRDAIAELRGYGWIDEVEASDLTLVECAYTWRWPGSEWRERAIEALLAAGIEPVGRYARWHFQGIAESLAEGFAAGARLAA